LTNLVYNNIEYFLKYWLKETEKQVRQLVLLKELLTFGNISVSGNMIPPLFVFSRIRYKDYFINSAPEGNIIANRNS